MEDSRIVQAIAYANQHHAYQKRKGKWPIPYISHPIEVMKKVSKLTMDEDILVASVLHDLIEDTAVTYNDIVNVFGARVADLVMECTRVSDSPMFKKLWLQLFKHKSFDSVIIKIADRYANCHDYADEGKIDKCINYYNEAMPLFKRFHKDASPTQIGVEDGWFQSLNVAVGEKLLNE